MQQMFEATWKQGDIIPKGKVNISDNARLIIIVLDEKLEAKQYSYKAVEKKTSGKRANEKYSCLKDNFIGSLKGVGKTITDLTEPMEEEWELD